MSALANLLVFIFGAIVGTSLDHLHVMGGVLDYPHVFFWGAAYWVWPLFGGAALALLWPWRLQFRGGAPRWPTQWPALLYFVAFAVAYETSVLLQRQPVLALAVFVGAWLPFAVRIGWRLVAYSALSALGGVLFESLLVHIDAFHYRAPGLMGSLAVPVWLPGLYLWACLAVRGIDLACFAPLRSAFGAGGTAPPPPPVPPGSK
jgi:hypothetical protein